VVFESYATNLVSTDTVTADIFIHDRQTGVTERISTAPGEVLANNGSYTPDISADGRYVVFRSAANNLVAGDTNGKSDIFLYDRQLGVMERVSVDSSGVQANEGSYSPSISKDGRYVAFQSAANNLVSDDTNGVDDIFVHDRQTGVTRRVSVDSSGVGANARSDSPSLSGNGRYVGFMSDASNLVSNDTNNMLDIFVHDHLTGVTQRVSVDSVDGQANGSSGSPSISEDGQFVAFASGASNLGNEDQNYFYDIFVHENDVVAKVVSILRANTDPTAAASVDFIVTFSEPVTDVDASDFSLHIPTGNILDPTIANVIADDACDSYCAAYLVTVNTGLGNGSLRLDILASANIVDFSGNALGNLPFITGEAYTIKKPAGVNVSIHESLQGTYSINPGTSTRQSYHAIDNGPVKIAGTNHIPLMAAERVIYKVNGMPASFSEMMALPASQLDTTYWLPWYNNITLDTQLRFANVSASQATVHVFIGTSEVGTFTLQAGESTRQSFHAINNGPVKIVSDQNIVAAQRVIYKVNRVNTSFSEMMALPSSQLDTTYWLPWYNNVDLDTQLRFGNVSDSVATIHVYIAGEEMAGSPFTLAPRAGVRKNFAGVNKGPVRIESDVPIVAAERVIHKVNKVNTSFSEMMALPNSQLDTTYWLPWYNNVDLDTQLRFANISTTQQALVRVYMGEQEATGSPFRLNPGTSIRQRFPGINDGPVRVESNTPIVVAERVVYKVNGIPTSFSEMMGLPNSQLDLTSWLPWYNNVGLDSQLRFAIP
jgi:hypothetical protein